MHTNVEPEKCGIHDRPHAHTPSPAPRTLHTGVQELMLAHQCCCLSDSLRVAETCFPRNGLIWTCRTDPQEKHVPTNMVKSRLKALPNRRDIAFPTFVFQTVGKNPWRAKKHTRRPQNPKTRENINTVVQTVLLKASHMIGML